MAADPSTGGSAPGRAERFVIDELRSRGASLFRPLVGADDVDLAVRAPEGQYVEMVVKTPEARTSARFRVGRFRPRPHAFFVCVVFEADQPSGAWVLPSGIFERFSTAAAGGASDLDLDGPPDEPLRERLSVYKDRWSLIAEYAKLRSTMADPVALQVRLALG